MEVWNKPLFKGVRNELLFPYFLAIDILLFCGVRGTFWFNGNCTIRANCLATAVTEK